MRNYSITKELLELKNEDILNHFLLMLFLENWKKKLGVETIWIPDTLLSYSLIEYGLLTTKKYEIGEDGNSYLPLIANQETADRLNKLVNDEADRLFKSYERKLIMIHKFGEENGLV